MTEKMSTPPYYVDALNREWVMAYAGFKCIQWRKCQSTTSFTGPGMICTQCREMYCFQCSMQQMSHNDLMMGRLFICGSCKKETS